MQYTELAHKIRIAVQKRGAEAALKESEERLRTIVDSIQVGIVTVDAKTHQILNVNPKAAVMIGKTNHEIIGSVCHQFICPAQEGSCPVTDLGQKIDLSERVILNKQGEKVPILKSVVPSKLAGKDVLIESFFDISERKKSENMVQTIIRSMVGGTGVESLVNITQNVSRWLGADFALITEITRDPDCLRVLSIQPAVDQIPVGLSLPLKGTPCELAAEKGFCLFSDNFQQSFPGCDILIGLNIRSCVGVALRDAGGKVIGTLCAFSKKPLQAPSQVQEIFEIIGVKAAAEIERKRTEEDLREKNLRVTSINEMVQDFAALPYGKRVEDLAAKKICDMTGAVVTTFNIYDPVAQMLRTTALEFAPGLLESLPGAWEKVTRLMGTQPNEIQVPVSREMYQDINRSVIGIKKTLTEISYGMIPPLVSAAIQKMSGIDRFIHIAHIIDGELYGTSVIGLRPGPSRSSRGTS